VLCGLLSKHTMNRKVIIRPNVLWVNHVCPCADNNLAILGIFSKLRFLQTANIILYSFKTHDELYDELLLKNHLQCQFVRRLYSEVHSVYKTLSMPWGSMDWYSYELGRYRRQMSNAHKKDKDNLSDDFCHQCCYTIHFGYIVNAKALNHVYKSGQMQSTYECQDMKCIFKSCI
jgi:hypothetical protein